MSCLKLFVALLLLVLGAPAWADLSITGITQNPQNTVPIGGESISYTVSVSSPAGNVERAFIDIRNEQNQSINDDFTSTTCEREDARVGRFNCGNVGSEDAFTFSRTGESEPIEFTLNFVLFCSAPAGATGECNGNSRTITTIVGDAGVVQFSEATFSVNENGQTATIQATRTGGVGEVRVTYLAENGTAASGSDFEGTKDILTWANGDTEPKTFDVRIIDDSEFEEDETVNLTLFDPSGAQLGNQSTATLTIVDDDPAPMANAGPDQTVRDSGNDGKENVQLDGSGTSNPDAIQSVEWIENDQVIAQQTATPTVSLSVGEHTITLMITYGDGLSDSDNVVITVVPPELPVANAGSDRDVRDSDDDGFESVTLDGSASSDPDGTALSFEWVENEQLIATGATPAIDFAVGEHNVTLVVTDEDGQSGQDTVTVTVNGISAPIANAGLDQTIEDTNFDGVEMVTLNASGSSDPDPEGSIVSFDWFEDGSLIATGVMPTVSLNVGRHEITLRVTDNEQLRTDDLVVITVTERAIPPGSSISTESPAVVRGDPGTELGPFNVQLVGPDNEPLAQVPVTWAVTPTDSGSMRDEMTRTDSEGRASNFVLVADPARFKVVASVPGVDPAQFAINGVTRPGLTETQRGMAETLDSACVDLDGTANRTEAQQNLLDTCNSLPTDDEGLAAALDQIAPDELSSQGTMAVEAADGQARLVGSRLSALRGGATGVSVSGLSLNLFGQHLPQVVLESALPRAGVGEGDSSSYVSPFGIFINGNFTFGDKDRSFNEPGFDFDAQDVTIGGDYRFTPELIFGAAVGYGKNETEFENAGGNIDFNAISLSLYGTYYQSQAVYVDGIVSFATNSYDTRRRISFTGAGEDAVGDTDGTEFTLSIGGGYDFIREAWTFGPYGRLTYLSADIDGYQESPTASGLELSLDDQEITSLATVIGGKAIYNISTGWGVFSPQVNLEWEHEFDNDSRLITGRFVNDPSQTRFGIPTDDPERDVFNLGAGATATFTGGKTGFIFVESLLGHEDLTQFSITGGFRFEF